MDWKIPLFKIYWDEEDIKAVDAVIKRGSYWATGPEIEEFEKEIAGYVGTEYAVAVNSGTSALRSILLAYNLQSRGQIIVPSFTFIATANVPLLMGAEPVFAEIEGITYGLDAEDVKNKITEKTKAIIPIHYGGCACQDIMKLKEIAEDNSLLLIEDAAQSLGAHIGGEMVGSFGDAAIFSLCQDKIISCGEGGMITTDSLDTYKKLKSIRSYGEREDYGYNFRMSTISAALVLSQFKRIDKIIKMRQRNAQHYTNALSKIKQIILPSLSDNFFHTYQKYSLQLRDGLRDRLMQHLTDKKISSRVYFNPVHLTPLYKKKSRFKEGDLPITEEISKRILSLPIYPELKKDEIDIITDSIKGLIEAQD